MTKKITQGEWAVRLLFLWIPECLLVLILPIYLYGWLKGALIYSGLSSLLHIAGIQCGMLPVYEVAENPKIEGEIK